MPEKRVFLSLHYSCLSFISKIWDHGILFKPCSLYMLLQSSQQRTTLHVKIVRFSHSSVMGTLALLFHVTIWPRSSVAHRAMSFGNARPTSPPPASSSSIRIRRLKFGAGCSSQRPRSSGAQAARRRRAEVASWSRVAAPPQTRSAEPRPEAAPAKYAAGSGAAAARPRHTHHARQ